MTPAYTQSGNDGPLSSSAKDIHSVLFISMGGIGNMVMLTPSVQLLVRHWPDMRCHYLIRKNHCREVIECHESTGDIIEWDHSAAGIIEIIKRIRKLHPDLVFSATGTNPLKCGLIGIIAGAPARIGEAFGAGRFLYTIRVPYGRSLHEIAANARLAAALVGRSLFPAFDLRTTRADRERARQFIGSLPGEQWIGVHAGSGPLMAQKRWPAERFAACARKLHERLGCAIVFFGGGEERDETCRMVSSLGAWAVNAAGELSIRETIETLRNCRLLITNDSGVMHCAAAAGCRIVALFGPTDDRKSGPWGDGHEVIRGSCACAPCYHGQPLYCGRNACMESIAVDDVADRALDVYARSYSRVR